MTGKRPRSRLLMATLGVVAATTLASATAGYALSTQAGLEELTLLAITFTVSTASFALYGFVATVTFVATLVAVLVAVEKIEEDGE